MLSRTAESLFWIGRYLERAEDLARVVDVAYHSRLERVGSQRRGSGEWEPLLMISGQRERFFASRHIAGTRSVAHFLTFDLTNPNSITSCLRAARDGANGLRDRITSEMWETLNTFYLWLMERSRSEKVRGSNLHALYSGIKERCHLFQGVAQGTMVHDEGWQFLRVGSYLERAMMTARILDIQYPHLLAAGPAGGPASVHEWMWLLRSVSAYEAYSKVVHLGIRPEPVVDFLIYDRAFPRSIHYAVATAELALRRISGSAADRPSNDAERVMGRLRATLAHNERPAPRDERLHHFLKNVQARCADVSDHLASIYFAYKVPGAGSA